MDVGEIRDLVRRPSRRSARLGVAVCLVLAVAIAWSVRQSRLTREALDRATAAEQAAAAVRTDVEQARAQFEGRGRPPKDPAIRRSRHDDPREIDRVQQLYQEIDGLNHLRDRVDQALTTDRVYTPRQPSAPR